MKRYKKVVKTLGDLKAFIAEHQELSDDTPILQWDSYNLVYRQTSMVSASGFYTEKRDIGTPNGTVNKTIYIRDYKEDNENDVYGITF